MFLLKHFEGTPIPETVSPRLPPSIFPTVNVLPDDSSPTDRTETREECSEQCEEKCDDQVIIYLIFYNEQFLHIMIILL